MTVHVLPKWQNTYLPCIDVTSSNTSWRSLSPFRLGPVQLYSRMWAQNVENAWQYSKLYAEHADGKQEPTDAYWLWARAGWRNRHAVRYPMGKAARPVYSLWADDHLDYIAARKRIYAPLYTQAVRFYEMPALTLLRDMAREGDIAIKDYDAYDHHALGYSWDDVMNDSTRKMGHGFVLAMMLEGVL